MPQSHQWLPAEEEEEEKTNRKRMGKKSQPMIRDPSPTLLAVGHFLVVPFFG
jgi:hypothetical protein